MGMTAPLVCSSQAWEWWYPMGVKPLSMGFPVIALYPLATARASCIQTDMVNKVGFTTIRLRHAQPRAWAAGHRVVDESN
eukprot:364479-Chlamydomonas_euryale.AAC.5